MNVRTNHQIISDHAKVIEMMSVEESKTALECSEKIKTHLEKALKATGEQRFANNLEVINAIISTYKKALGSVKTSFYDGELGLAS